MNATAWVAVAGIAATFSMGLLNLVLAERMRRKSARLDRLLDRRLEVYADLLTATARFTDNAESWSAFPGADLNETDDQELDRLISQVRVVGSEKVYQRFEVLKKDIHEFNRLLLGARTYDRTLRDSGKADDSTAMQQRMTLASVADKIKAGHKELEALIRKDIGR